MKKFKAQVAAAVSTALGRPVEWSDVVYPPKASMGDLSFPCFPLAKVRRMAPPRRGQRAFEIDLDAFGRHPSLQAGFSEEAGRAHRPNGVARARPEAYAIDVQQADGDRIGHLLGLRFHRFQIGGPAISVPELHRTELFQLGREAGHRPYDDHGGGGGQQAVRDPLNLCRVRSAHLVGVVLPVVYRKVVDDLLLHAPRDLAGRLEQTR